MLLKKKYSFIFLTLCFAISILSAPKVDGSTTSLNTMIDGGTIQSVNITSSEFTTSNTGSTPNIVIGDGKISSLWSDVTPHPITSFGPNGYIKSMYGKNSIYFLLAQDPSYTWIACQWDSTNTSFANVKPMEPNDDMWIFGTTPHGTYGDAYALGQGIIPKFDAINNLQYEKVLVNDSKGNIISIDWEVSHPYMSNDTAGHDIQFNSMTQQYTVLFASNIYHKVDTKITESKFVFSNLKLGQVVSLSTSTNTNPILVDRFMYTQVEYGLIAAIIAVVVTIYLPIILKITRRK